MKRIFAFLMIGVVVLSFMACAAPAAEPAASEPAAEEAAAAEPEVAESEADVTGALIGFAMPTHSDESWLKHKTYMQQYLEEMGYTNFDEQWAEDVVATQVSQIENMVTKGVQVLVVAAVDGSSLTDVLAKAAAQGTKVVAYDRLIMNTEFVDAYVTGDNFRVGVEEANYIVRTWVLRMELVLSMLKFLQVQWMTTTHSSSMMELCQYCSHTLTMDSLLCNLVRLRSRNVQFNSGMLQQPSQEWTIS